MEARRNAVYTGIMRTLILFLTACLVALTGPAQAHCDTPDGPVVPAAQKALDTGNLEPVLMWIHPEHEAEVREAFRQALEVRALSPAARQLADRYFVEVVVRVHRAGEGEPYTGLKPAGTDPGPAIRAADRSLERGELDPVRELLGARLDDSVRHAFEEVRAAEGYQDTEGGRKWVAAYVHYLHLVEARYRGPENHSHH